MKNTLTFEIKNKSGEVLAKQSGQDFVHLVYENEYAEGDCIVFSVSQKKSFLVIQFDTVLNPAFVYIKEHTFVYEIPFGEKRFSYDPKTFTGNLHLLKARAARPERPRHAHERRLFSACKSQYRNARRISFCRAQCN